MVSSIQRKIFTGQDICAVIPTAGKRMTTLWKALSSVLEQSEMCGEIIVVWDSPKTPPPDLRIGGKVRVIQTRSGSKGVAAARNTAILATNLTFIALLDDDDYWLPHKIEEYVKAINSSSEVGFYISRGQYITESGRILGVFPSKKYRQEGTFSSYINNNILLRRRRVSIPTSSFVFPRQGIHGINLFDEGIFLAEDLLLLLKLEQFLPFHLVGHEPLSVTTIHQFSNEGLSKRPIIFSDWIKIHKEYFSFLAPRQFDNATLYFGIRHFRQSKSLRETILWFLKNSRTNADFITILSTSLWLFANEALLFSKNISNLAKKHLT